MSDFYNFYQEYTRNREDDDFDFMFDDEYEDFRRKKLRYNRIDWDYHLKVCGRTRDGFARRYHMSEESFNILVDLLDITVDESKSRASTSGNEPIWPHFVVAIGLRFLHGSGFDNLVDNYGLSDTHARYTVSKFLRFVLNCDHLALQLPMTEEDRQRVMAEFDELSRVGNIFHGVIGIIDGWICFINKPDVPNSADYWTWCFPFSNSCLIGVT